MKMTPKLEAALIKLRDAEHSLSVAAGDSRQRRARLSRNLAVKRLCAVLRAEPDDEAEAA